MKNQPNNTTVKGGLTTPWKKEMLPPFGCDIWSGERCICTMDDYPDAEKDADLIVESVNNHAKLRERVKELEAWKNIARDLINEIENRQTTADLMHIYAEESGVRDKDMAVYETGFYDGMTFFRRRLNEELK